MKKTILLVVLSMALTNYVFAQYVDLGLPSGTLWSSENHPNQYEHPSVWGDLEWMYNSLPTVEQFHELIDNCSWRWTGNGCKVTGKNGNSIFLPAEGFISSDGSRMAIGSGCYWGQDYRRSAGGGYVTYACLTFSSDGIPRIFYYKSSSKRSIRLVK